MNPSATDSAADLMAGASEAIVDNRFHSSFGVTHAH